MKLLKKIVNKILGKSRPKVAVISLYGVIGSNKAGFSSKSNLCLDTMAADIEKAFALPNLKAVALAINSPGGAPVQTEILSNFIRKKAANKGVKIYSFVEDVAASGGYWLACTGEEIFASASSIVGSIGVISASFGFEEAIKKIGVERRIFSQGKNKSILDPFKEIKQEDVELLLSAQKDVHENFKNYVKSSRADKLTASEEELFNGKFWSGVKAQELGLIDGIGDLYSTIKEKFGQQCEIVRIVNQGSWLQKKFGISSITIDDILARLQSFSIWNKFGL